MIQPFKQFNARILPQLNRWLREFNKLNNLRGDEFIKIKKSGAGTTVSLDLDRARTRLSRKPGTSTAGAGGASVRRAVCNQDAGFTNVIYVNLFDETTGIEITDGVEFVDYNIPVTCNISGGIHLNSSLPRLEFSDQIFITQSVYDNAGTPETIWYCVSNFQASADCTCGT